VQSEQPAKARELFREILTLDKDQQDTAGKRLNDAAEAVEDDQPESGLLLYELSAKLEHGWRELSYDRWARLASDAAKERLDEICREGLALFPSDLSLVNVLLAEYRNEPRRILALLPRDIELEVGKKAHFLENLSFVFNETREFARTIRALETFRAAGGGSLESARLNVANAFSGLGRHEEAEALLHQAHFELAGAPVIDHALACVHMARGDRARTLRSVRAAHDKGYEDIHTMQSDRDLAPIATDPEFLELVREASSSPRGFAQPELVAHCIAHIQSGSFKEHARPLGQRQVTIGDKPIPATLRQFLEFDASFATLARVDARGTLASLIHPDAPQIGADGRMQVTTAAELLDKLLASAVAEPGFELDDEGRESLAALVERFGETELVLLPSSRPGSLVLFAGVADRDGEYPIIDLSVSVTADPESQTLIWDYHQLELVYPSFDLYLADQLGLLETAARYRRGVGAWEERFERHVENNPSLEDD
jgi:hypothetical protein